MDELEKQGRINALTEALRDSDYKIIEYFEGAISEDEYSKIKESRNIWRKEIQKLTT